MGIIFVAVVLLGARDVAAQGLAGAMTAIGIGSTLQGIGGLNSAAQRGRAQGVVANNNNYQNTLNGLMTDPNAAPAPQQPPPVQPPVAQTGVQQPGGTNTTAAVGTRPISSWGATGLAQISANPRNIMSTLGNYNGGGTNQLSSRPRISLRVQTVRITSTRSGISTRGGMTGGGTNQLGVAGGGQQQQGGQQGGVGGGQQGGGAPPPAPVNPNAGGN